MTKERVLCLLLQEKGNLSGEVISRELHISRAAVNAAIQSLRSDGYRIASATRRGYRLEQSPDRLTAGELMARLSEERMKTVLCLDSVDSTNDRLRELAHDGAPSGQIVIANCQTAGRGRRGRSFMSPADRGIYLSLLLRPDGAPSDTAAITAWTAVAAARAIHAVCGIQPGIKWVNDLVLEQKKVCGILTEMVVEGESGRIQSVIIGIGINVNQTAQEFPPSLQTVATSLRLATGTEVCRADLAAALIAELSQLCADWPTEAAAYLAAYRAASVTVGKEVRLFTLGSNDTLGRPATALAISDSFGLTVRYPDGSTAEIASGECSVRGLYGYT